MSTISPQGPLCLFGSLLDMSKDYLVGNYIIFRVISVDAPVILLPSLAGKVGGDIWPSFYCLVELEDSVVFARLFGLLNGLREGE